MWVGWATPFSKVRHTKGFMKLLTCFFFNLFKYSGNPVRVDGAMNNQQLGQVGF